MDCKQCKRNFKSKQALRYHEKNNVCGKAPICKSCSNCNKVFSTKQMLQYHQEHGVCLKHLCVCGGDDKDDWHNQRCRQGYDLEDIVCYDHGDLIERCCNEETIKKLVLRKKEIDQRFCKFDDAEGVPWENQVYWQDDCKYCGCRRDGQHIRQCLAVKETPRSFEKYMEGI